MQQAGGHILLPQRPPARGFEGGAVAPHPREQRLQLLPHVLHWLSPLCKWGHPAGALSVRGGAQRSCRRPFEASRALRPHSARRAPLGAIPFALPPAAHPQVRGPASRASRGALRPLRGLAPVAGAATCLPAPATQPPSPQPCTPAVLLLCPAHSTQHAARPAALGAALALCFDWAPGRCPPATPSAGRCGAPGCCTGCARIARSAVGPRKHRAHPPLPCPCPPPRCRHHHAQGRC